MTLMNDTLPPQARKVMGIFAHPDDAEFFAGATFARWAAEGADVRFVIATSGDKGSDDPQMTSARLAELREAEAQEAAKRLGVKGVIFLRYPDGELFPTLELRRDLVRQIRIHQPEIVVTSDPTAYWYGTGYVNHPDHRAIGDATLAAVFPAARDRLNFLEHETLEGLSVHKTKQLYIAIPTQPTTTIDVTAYLDTKLHALQAHASQFKPESLEQVAEWVRKDALDPESPKETQRYIEKFRVMTLD